MVGELYTELSVTACGDVSYCNAVFVTLFCFVGSVLFYNMDNGKRQALVVEWAFISAYGGESQ